MAVLDFKRSTTTPSTLAKGTLQFVKVGSRFKMLVGDNANSPTEANYLPFEGGTLTGSLTLSTNIASPLILTRSGDVGINMNGSYLGVSGGVLRFGTNTTHANNATVWTSGNLTQASINTWNAAYGWGDHAGKYIKNVTMLSAASIDTAVESGIYRNENGLGGVWAFSPVLTLRSSDTGAQIAVSYGSVGMKFRGFGTNGTTFGAWRDVWHDGNLRSNTQNDGRYVLKAGDTMSGSMTIKKGSSVATYTAGALNALSFGNTGTAASLLWGEYYGAIIASSSTASNYYVLRVTSGMNATGTSGTAILSIYGNGLSEFTGKVKAPIIDATAALIIPNAAPTSPEANRTYLWIS